MAWPISLNRIQVPKSGMHLNYDYAMVLTQEPCRFFPTSNGNFKRWKVGLRHLNVTFSPERVNRLSRSVLVNNTQKKMLHKVLPYK